MPRWHVWYRTVGDGRAPARVVLPGRDYEEGPTLEGDHLHEPLNVQIELNRPPRPAPVEVDDLELDEDEDFDEDEEDAADMGDDVRAPPEAGDVILDASGNGWILTPEGVWAGVSVVIRQPKRRTADEAFA